MYISNPNQTDKEKAKSYLLTQQNDNTGQYSDQRPGAETSR